MKYKKKKLVVVEKGFEDGKTYFDDVVLNIIFILKMMKVMVRPLPRSS